MHPHKCVPIQTVMTPLSSNRRTILKVPTFYEQITNDNERVESREPVISEIHWIIAWDQHDSLLTLPHSSSVTSAGRLPGIEKDLWVLRQEYTAVSSLCFCLEVRKFPWDDGFWDCIGKIAQVTRINSSCIQYWKFINKGIAWDPFQLHGLWYCELFLSL